ncbi:MAG: hypothetical protein K0R00_3714 [Herbinix sp.]|nr:hypothetical protein [Herbinix sp.]
MTNSSRKVYTMAIAALLSTIGILIPLYSPLKIRLDPASFTLGVHVPIFIAMFISPVTALFVSLITALGFLAAYPPVIVIRALTHIIFAVLGAYILKKNNNILLSLKTAIPFVVIISVIHAAAEVIVVSIFYFFGDTSSDFVRVVLGLVGVGGTIHSILDFMIAAFIWVPLQRAIQIPSNARIRITSISK